MRRLLLGTMGVKSLVQGLNAAATAGFEPRTVWSEVRRRNRLATASPAALWHMHACVADAKQILCHPSSSVLKEETLNQTWICGGCTFGRNKSHSCEAQPSSELWPHIGIVLAIGATTAGSSLVVCFLFISKFCNSFVSARPPFFSFSLHFLCMSLF